MWNVRVKFLFYADVIFEISACFENDYYHPTCIHAVDQSPLLLFFLIQKRIKPVPNIIHHLKQRKRIGSLL